MEAATRVRSAARDTIADTAPTHLGEVIDERLASTSMIPGVLVILSARVFDDSSPSASVTERAVGVQLIYEGLRLSRTLIREPPWDGEEQAIPADMDVLAADVLVSRGFLLLAGTSASTQAGEVVRAFGRSETRRRCTPEKPVSTVEADVFELAVVAGTGLEKDEVSLALRQYVGGLADSRAGEPLEPAAESLPVTLESVMRRVSGGPRAEDSSQAQSAGSLNRND